MSISHLNDFTNLQINDNAFLMIYLGEFAVLVFWISIYKIFKQMVGDLLNDFCGQSVNNERYLLWKYHSLIPFFPMWSLPDLSQLKSIWISVTKEVQTRDLAVHDAIHLGSIFNVWLDLNFFCLKHLRYWSVSDPICLNYFSPRNVSLQICKAWQIRCL